MNRTLYLPTVGAGQACPVGWTEMSSEDFGSEFCSALCVYPSRAWRAGGGDGAKLRLTSWGRGPVPWAARSAGSVAGTGEARSRGFLHGRPEASLEPHLGGKPRMAPGGPQALPTVWHRSAALVAKMSTCTGWPGGQGPEERALGTALSEWSFPQGINFD